MDNLLRRRAGFWRNLEYSLDQLSNEVNSRGADKWVDDVEKAYIKSIYHSLTEVLSNVRFRYKEVLEEQIKEAKPQYDD